MTRPTNPRTPPLYHGALDAASATWLTLLAVTAFYTAAALLSPGLPQLVTAQLVLGGVAVLAVALRGARVAEPGLGPSPAATSRALGLVAPRRRAALGALLIGVSAWYPNLALALWLQAKLGGATRVPGIERLVEAPHLAATLLCLTIFPALCEELAFRGLWARALARRHGVVLAAVITAPVFGAYHLSSAQLVPATLLGAILAWSSLRTGSLWVSIIIHAANNATAILAARGRLGPIGAALEARPDLALPALFGLTLLGLTLIASAPSTSPPLAPSPPPPDAPSPNAPSPSEASI